MVFGGREGRAKSLQRVRDGTETEQREERATRERERESTSRVVNTVM
jgi:hypothetical protein